jgi:hypothetical protein
VTATVDVGVQRPAVIDQEAFLLAIVTPQQELRRLSWGQLADASHNHLMRIV